MTTYTVVGHIDSEGEVSLDFINTEIVNNPEPDDIVVDAAGNIYAVRKLEMINVTQKVREILGIHPEEKLDPRQYF